MTDIFISYSRKDIAFARLLHEALKENGFETWIDWQDIPPSTDWLKEVYTAIEQTDTFIFILSSASTLSEVCKLEIEHARKNNKRLIPIVINQVDPTQVHPALAALNWIFSRTENEVQPAIQSLVTAIQTDYEWAKAHTRLQMRALEWERAGNDRSFLLRGSDLSQAESWISVAAEKAPEPTLLQTRYLQASRQEAVKRQRSLLLAVGAALLVTAVLGVVAVINGLRAARNAVSLSTQVVVAQNAESTAEQEANFRLTQVVVAQNAEATAAQEAIFRSTQQAVAEEQRNIAESKQLAASALSLAETKLDLALLLSVEGYRKDDNYLTRGSLLSVLQQDPNLLRQFHGHSEISSIVWDPNGAFFVSTGDKLIRFWDPKTGLQIGEPLLGHTSAIKKIAISPDGKLLASVSGPHDKLLASVSGPHDKLLASVDDYSIRLWDIADRNQIAILLTEYSFNSPEEVIFSPDSSLVAGRTSLGEVYLWDTHTHKILTPNSEPLKFRPLHNILFSPNGSMLITNSNDGIEFWNVETGEKVNELLLNDSIVANIREIAVNPEGTLLAGSDAEGQIYFWDLTTYEFITKKMSQNNDTQITNIEFNPAGNYLFTVNDKVIESWNVKTKVSNGVFQTLYDIKI